MQKLEETCKTNGEEKVWIKVERKGENEAEKRQEEGGRKISERIRKVTNTVKR